MFVLSTAQAQQAIPAAPLASATTASALATDPQAIRVLLSPELETVLASQMLGRIANVQAGLGEKVAKGKTLISFDCSEANARQRMAQAEYANAKETLDAKERLRKDRKSVV